jgi:hypothetical protein
MSVLEWSGALLPWAFVGARNRADRLGCTWTD